MPDVDPSNSYGTPEGPELDTPDVPTEPDAGAENTAAGGGDRTSVGPGEDLATPRSGPKK